MVEAQVHRILTNRMSHGSVHGADLRFALGLFRDMRLEYIRRERLAGADRALLNRFANHHLVNILHHAYRRSSAEDPARGIAARAALGMGLRNPLPLGTVMLKTMRSRMRK